MRLAMASRLYQTARRNEFAPATRRHVRETLLHATHDIGPDVAVRALKRKHVEAWVASMDCSPATIRNRLSIFRVFCRWCIVSGHLRQDPTLGIRGPRQPEAMPRELVGDEVERLLAVVPDRRGELIVMLGLVQGMRRGAMAAQLREDIDLSGRMMLVTRTKGGRQLWLPLMPDTYDTVIAYYREVPGATGPLLRSAQFSHRGITAGYITTLVSSWMTAAGIKLHAFDGKSSHALRHTFSGVVLDDGGDLRDLQAALGHSDLQSTYKYLRRRQADGALRKAMGTRRYLEAS